MSELFDMLHCHLSKKWRLGAETPGHLLLMQFIICADDDGADDYSAVARCPATRMRTLMQVRVPFRPVTLRPTYH
jgi:hypothetical protein